MPQTEEIFRIWPPPWDSISGMAWPQLGAHVLQQPHMGDSGVVDQHVQTLYPGEESVHRLAVSGVHGGTLAGDAIFPFKLPPEVFQFFYII